MIRRIRSALAATLAAALLACGDTAQPPTASGDLSTPTSSASSPLKFRQVSVGEDHSCGVTTDDVAYCWGSNESGQLGNETVASSTTPVPVAGDHRFRQVSAEGRWHSCGVSTENVAYCWGTNDFGQLGNGTEMGSAIPSPVAGGLRFREVNAGTLHTCGVTTRNAAYCWGHNQEGALGNGERNASPNPVAVRGGLTFRQVSAGNDFTCGVTTENVAYCWGTNSVGQLGIGNNTGPLTCFSAESLHGCAIRPVRVARRLAFSRVSSGDRHTCGVTTDGSAFCWGEPGALGREDVDGLRPVKVAGRLTFAKVSAGDGSCGVTTAHVAYCWGTRPVQVDTELRFLDVQAGDFRGAA
jgi:alpha-tubulin suppressor-like RCC1 family protein